MLIPIHISVGLVALNIPLMMSYKVPASLRNLHTCSTPVLLPSLRYFTPMVQQQDTSQPSCHPFGFSQHGGGCYSSSLGSSELFYSLFLGLSSGPSGKPCALLLCMPIFFVLLWLHCINCQAGSLFLINEISAHHVLNGMHLPMLFHPMLLILKSLPLNSMSLFFLLLSRLQHLLKNYIASPVNGRAPHVW